MFLQDSLIISQLNVLLHDTAFLLAGMHTCNLGIVQWLNGSTIHKLREFRFGCFRVWAAPTPHASHGGIVSSGTYHQSGEY